jgi:hypothetical protein
MTHFEAYRWEDHVPRAGSWKFNLKAGVLALGLISGAFPNTDGKTAMATSAVAAPNKLVEVSNRLTIQPVKSRWAYCPTASADTAGS